MSSQTLVIDIGGTSVKFSISGEDERKFVSGRWLTPEAMVRRVLHATDDWSYDRISIGYPGQVRLGKVAHEPWNLADGWMDYDFAANFHTPVRLINDACLQALGNYEGGRMLFMGLGTSLGAALIVDNVVVGLEMGCLAHPSGGTLEERVSSKALRAAGRSDWRGAVLESLSALKNAFVADYIKIGGGNARLIRKLPEGCRHGEAQASHIGGCRLWNTRTMQSTYLYSPKADVSATNGSGSPPRAVLVRQRRV
ncbi:MAG TPA: ROK family protein [Pirellulaceae bacterium]|nr:ROK family protein [Pirellulaceae bacterium]